jgi:hypothetical protein
VKSYSFQADPEYEFLINLFVEMISIHCIDAKYDFDWNNKLRSSSANELSTSYTYQKANTSLALGNNNISRVSNNNSPNPDDSNFIQINDDINNLSIFKKDLDFNKLS